MMSIHGLDHRAPFRYASSAFQRVAGMNPREVLGLGLMDLIVPEDHATVQEVLLKVGKRSHAKHFGNGCDFACSRARSFAYSGG